MRCLPFLLCSCFLASAADYPLKVASGGRYLVDQNDQPFLIVGDSPHNLFINYTTSEAATYLSNRATNAVNSLYVECIGGLYTSCPADGSNKNGDKPFIDTLPGGLYDLTSTNPPYWSHAADIVTMAATNGLQVILDSFETGQYTDTALVNGTNRCRQYGNILGNIFKDFTNVLWITGNDYQTWNTATNDACISSIALGIRDSDTNHAHLDGVILDYPVSMSYNATNWRSIIDYNGVYCYYFPYDETLQAYNTNTMPVIFLEGAYEGEALGFGDGGTANNLRRQEYWTLLSGSLGGHIWGNGKIWVPAFDWADNLNSVGTTHLGYFSNFFGTRAWYTLVPDQTHKLLAAGYGTFEPSVYSETRHNEDGDYAVAAFNTNGTLGVIYTPTNHTLTVVMTNFTGYVTSRWFDPTTNTFTAITGSPFANTVTTNLSTPGNNSAGEKDWVLLLESGAASPPAEAAVVNYQNLYLR